MAKTTPVYARIDSGLKEEAEAILNKLGVTPASLIQMVYSQIVLKKRLPFEVSVNDSIVSMKDLTKEELALELEKGMESLQRDKVYSASEVRKIFENRK